MEQSRGFVWVERLVEVACHDRAITPLYRAFDPGEEFSCDLLALWFVLVCRRGEVNVEDRPLSQADVPQSDLFEVSPGRIHPLCPDPPEAPVTSQEDTKVPASGDVKLGPKVAGVQSIEPTQGPELLSYDNGVCMPKVRLPVDKLANFVVG